jgi:uncharacterized membrane protein YphA (DoxX/SURF4 family)
MNTTLWIIQGALAVVFLGSGAAKISWSRERLIASGQTGVAVYPMPVVRFAAFTELLAGVGLILPWATDIAPVLTPLAGLGVCALMVGAAYAHKKLREPVNVAANTILFAAALTVAIARFGQL